MTMMMFTTTISVSSIYSTGSVVVMVPIISLYIIIFNRLLPQGERKGYRHRVSVRATATW